MNIQTLPGFRTFYPTECAQKNSIFTAWRKIACCHGFLEYEAPILEPLELFTEKSGPEIKEQLFHFVDKGGRAIALRPELTPSVVRMVAAKVQTLRKPIKWFNIGEQFRFERPQKGRLRSFYQLNVDCFGLEDVTADAEVIACLIQLFTTFGLTEADFKIRLSDRQLWFQFFYAKGLNQDQVHIALGIIDKMEREHESETLKKLSSIFPEHTPAILLEIQAIAQARDFQALKAALGQTLKAQQLSLRLDEWSQLLSLLNQMGMGPFIQIDLSIVRGLAYYTGFVFEAFQTTLGGRALAGGGRYDDSVEKLGGPSLPAVGFAIGDVTFTDLLRKKNLLPVADHHPDCFLVSMGEKSRSVLLGDIQRIRAAGIHAEYVLHPTTLTKQLKMADQMQAQWLIIYGEEEVERGYVQVRSSSSREEQEIEHQQLIDYLHKLMIPSHA